MEQGLQNALAEAEQGMARALDRAEADFPAWGDLALAWLRRYAETHAQFPGWFVTEESSRDPNFPAPKNSRAWGAIWKQAQRLGIIEASGRTMPHPRRHGCPAVVWRSLVYTNTGHASPLSTPGMPSAGAGRDPVPEITS